MKMLVEEYLGKDKTLYAAFMDLEKAYDRVNREALWSVLIKVLVRRRTRRTRRTRRRRWKGKEKDNEG